MMLDWRPSGTLVGASQTDDPTGNWNLYKVTIAAADAGWADFPSIGLNAFWVVVQVNMIVGSTFSRSHIYVFSKSDLTTGGAGSFQLLSISSQGGTQVP